MSFIDGIISDSVESNIASHYTNIDTNYSNVDLSYSSLNSITQNFLTNNVSATIGDGNTNYNTINNQIRTNLTGQILNINDKNFDRGESDDFLTTMDNSYNTIKDKINIYDDKREELKTKLLTYNNTVGRLNDARSNKYYILFIVWLVIFFVILFTVFSNVVEEQKTMNLPTKVLVFLFIAFIFYFIIKNTYMYFSGYR